MSGIRIQHPTKRNALFTIMDSTRPYWVPFQCAACHRVHQFKTYHLRLDEAGAAIVSVEIVERLRRIPGQPFAIANEVATPPDQIITAPRLQLRLRATPPGG